MHQRTRTYFPTLAITLTLATTALILLHQYLTDYHPPFDGPLDIAFHITIALMKCTVILVLFPSMLAHLHPAIHAHPRHLLSFILAAMALYLIIAILHTTFTREALARIASGDTTRFYYNDPGPLDALHYIGLHEWRAAWSICIPQLKDTLLTLAWVLTVTIPLYLLKAPRASALIATIAGYGLVMIATPALGLIVLDYDTFLGGILWDIAWLNLFPIALPFFDLSTAVLLVFLLAWFALIVGITHRNELLTPD